MRVDQFLRAVRLIKKRETAKELCKEGAVKVNGKIVKPSKEVKEGDLIEIDTIYRRVKVRILGVPPRKNVPKKQAKDFYLILEDEKKDFRKIINL